MPGFPRIVAHRGASFVCRENTMPAFRRALEDGAETVECDLRLTADRQWVIHHDPAFDLRGQALRIADLSLLELGKSTIAAGIDPIPTLVEFLAWCKAAQIRPVLDIKDASGLEELVATVDAAGLSRSPLISAFRQSVVYDIHRLRPEWDTALIVGDPRLRLVRRLMFGRFLRRGRAHGTAALHLHERWVTPGVVQAIHRAGMELAIWTVDDPKRITLLAILGVDSIITNRPDLARDVRTRLGSDI